MTNPPTNRTATVEPTSRDARRRSGLVYQSLRFVVLNLKILRLTRQHR